MNRSSHRLIAGMLATMSLGLAENASAQCRYEIITLASSNDISDFSPIDVNALGDDGSLAIEMHTRENSFLTGVRSPDSSIRFLETPEGFYRAVARGLVDGNLVVGTASQFNFTITNAIVWVDEQPQLLAAPSRFWATYARGVNRRGTVFGGAFEDVDGIMLYSGTPAIWTRGRFQALEMPFGYSGYIADMNNHDLVAGNIFYGQIGSVRTEIAIWHNRHLQIVGRPEGAFHALCRGMNDQGIIVGASQVNYGTPTLPFTWQRGKFGKLLLPTGISGGGANDINELGHVVGWLNSSAEGTKVGAIWLDNVPHDLNDLVPADEDRLIV